MYQWQIDRPNNEPFGVVLNVHADADKIHTDWIAETMAPNKDASLAPNLKRVAVVSSPVMTDKLDKDGKPERADKKLNAALNKALAQAKVTAASDPDFGWC